jgi:hypothetical protein
LLYYTNIEKEGRFKSHKFIDEATYYELFNKLNTGDFTKIRNPNFVNLSIKNYNDMMVEYLSNNQDKVDSLNFTQYVNDVQQILNDNQIIFDYQKFYNIYKLHHGNGCDTITKNEITLKNITYQNTNWYDENNNSISKTLKDDFEYKYHDYKENDCKIIRKFDDNFVSLNYIYDFYNFGEFWDVCIRLHHMPKNKKLILMSTNRIDNIEYYFKKMGFDYNNSVFIDNKQGGFNFNSVTFTKLGGFCRGYLDNFNAFILNNTFNEKEINNNNYKIYLSRGKFGREIIDEQVLINKLKTLGFIILDGSETLQEIQEFFTNATFILYPHGSLVKNCIYCKKNPILIELAPVSRCHLCFTRNSVNMKFNTTIFFVDTDDNERIILNDVYIKNLIKFISFFI